MVRSFLAKFSPKSEARLLALCLNNPNNEQDINEWNKKAVRYLVRGLGKDLKLIDELEKAISQQSSKTKCILVPKTPDRRLLVSHRRGLPQVIYCRLWRWPDLQSHHQIKAIDSCDSCDESPPSLVQYPTNDQKICINPYHYERIFPKPIDPILVPCQKIPPDLSTSFEDSDTIGETKARPGHIHFLHQFQIGSHRAVYPNMVNDFVRTEPTPQYSQGSQQATQQQLYQQYESPGTNGFQNAASQQQYVHSQESCSFQTQQIDTYDSSREPQFQQGTDQYQHSQPTTQYQQQYQPGTSLQASPGTVASQPPPQPQQLAANIAELARPFRFKQHRFAQIARARQEGTIANRYPIHDPQGYAPVPFAYSSQPQAQIQVTYQPYQSVAANGQPGDQQQCSATNFTSSDNQSVHYAQQASTSNYTTIYSPNQQAQYTHQDHQMHLNYQTDSIASKPTDQNYYNQNCNVTSLDPDQPMDQTPIIDIQEVPYTEGTFWCSISYHEYYQRIGEKYHSNCRIVCVDGYTQPMCSDRFCIGGISNINRDQFTEWVRRRIGRGVRFSYVDGEVYVEGLSESSIFVSNPLLIDETEDKLIDNVSKLTQGCSAKVFSTQEFSKLLTEAVTKGFEAVYKLTNCCVVRVSFVKGWGKNYKRQSIFNTPCWVEVQLNGPLQWIDKVLRQMRPPTGCGSTS